VASELDVACLPCQFLAPETANALYWSDLGKFFHQAFGAPIPLLRAHAVTCTQCACQNFVLDQYEDHVLTCKKHIGAIAGHHHVMNVSVQVARNSCLRVRVNRKVDTTAAK